jgi:sulfoxide reductase catalytic subunit YedY
MDKIPSSEITDRKVYVNRREFMRAAGLGALATAGGALALEQLLAAQQPAVHGRKLTTVKSALSTTETPNTWEHITTYNNFYEFDTGGAGAGPSRFARNFKPEPWSVVVEGECAKVGKLNLEDVLKGETLEDRIYRHRCVEAWSMVIPWVGFPLRTLLDKVEPGSQARYVAFQTLLDPNRMPNQRTGVLDWPYVEGLRLDEAMHPLTIMATGMYDETLPPQDGAPIRLVVPWKYGFKSIKSVVKITLVADEPPTTWNIQAPDEYGFYSNVNPNVPHPRWSQATERRIGEYGRRDTLLFNGYGEQVADLYRGMDLVKYF